MDSQLLNGNAVHGIQNGKVENETSPLYEKTPRKWNQSTKVENGTSPLYEKTRREPGTFRITKDANFNFLEDLFTIMIEDGLKEGLDRDSQVCNFKQPEKLRAIFSDLVIEEGPVSADKLLDISKKIIKYSVKTGHPRFYNQLIGGMDQYSLGGAWLTDTLNASQYTYEVSPVFTIMEKEVYKKVLDLIGFDGGDAIFCPGGSIANFYGMNVARYNKCPEVKTKGLMCLKKPLVYFTSDKAHYSWDKAAATLGLGTNSMIDVKTDECGKMIPEALDQAILTSIAEGFEPFFVNATAGTTVLGAYDPINEIADICEKYSLWLHVDGAWGGSAMLSRTYRPLLNGIERADSMTWNPHKMMGIQQQCSMFLCKHKGLLIACHSANARYLFQQDKHYDVSYDTGDMSLQCSRKVDVLKLWMVWKGKGDQGIEKDIDQVFRVSRYLAKRLKETEGFMLLQEPECTNVCFFYIPPSLRGQDRAPEWWDKLSKVAPVIKERMLLCGSMMIGYQPDGQYNNFFRMIVSNCDSTLEDMDFLVQEIDRLGCDL